MIETLKLIILTDRFGLLLPDCLHFLIPAQECLMRGVKKSISLSLII